MSNLEKAPLKRICRMPNTTIATPTGFTRQTIGLTSPKIEETRTDAPSRAPDSLRGGPDATGRARGEPAGARPLGEPVALAHLGGNQNDVGCKRLCAVGGSWRTMASHMRPV